METDKIAYHLRMAMMFSILAANQEIYAEESLGHFPLCEASAVLLMPCRDKQDGECLIVSDNEQGRELYSFAIKDDKLSPSTNPTIDLNLNNKQEISDIEALTSTSANEILAFASHSRNSKCEIKKKRHQFGKVDLAAHKTTIVDTLKSTSVTCDHLFTNPAKDASILSACQAIDSANANAADIESKLDAKNISDEEAKTNCNKLNAFNAEGAVALKTDKGVDVWIGLRAPLLPIHPNLPDRKNLAILLHLKDTSAYRFDRVAYVDLEGRGIRDLSVDGDFIWLIAGPAEDRSEPFQLRRITKSALEQSKVINAELVKDDLPNSSEGLAVSGKTVYVVIDGDAGKDQSACSEPAKYKILTLN
ncbi:hypothetical protein BROC_02213 [Candidatus Brocadiaceae bacterium]|nr:hypothetical protein BROC_02213 [Candidatus Brocadiaceae bacterium]